MPSEEWVPFRRLQDCRMTIAPNRQKNSDLGFFTWFWCSLVFFQQMSSQRIAARQLAKTGGRASLKSRLRHGTTSNGIVTRRSDDMSSSWYCISKYAVGHVILTELVTKTTYACLPWSGKLLMPSLHSEFCSNLYIIMMAHCMTGQSRNRTRQTQHDSERFDQQSCESSEQDRNELSNLVRTFMFASSEVCSRNEAAAAAVAIHDDCSAVTARGDKDAAMSHYNRSENPSDAAHRCLMWRSRYVPIHS